MINFILFFILIIQFILQLILFFVIWLGLYITFNVITNWKYLVIISFLLLGTILCLKLLL